MSAVWVTRPVPGNRRTARVLKEAGFEVVVVPVLEIDLVRPTSGFPASEFPDWVVFVSANAVRGLEHAIEGVALSSRSRNGVKVAAVGARTAKEAETHGWRPNVVPERESAEGLLDALTDRDLHGRSVWIPAGNRKGSATDILPAGLASRGARVDTIGVYATRKRNPTEPELDELAGPSPGAVICHSPSGAEAIWGDDPPEPVRRWRRAAAIAAGARTAARCVELGASPVFEATSPSDDGILAALQGAMS
jgi:uroporphyrinogen-III synthase